MLFLRAEFALAVQRLERERQVLPGFRGFDDLVDQPAAGRNIGISKRLPILFD